MADQVNNHVGAEADKVFVLMAPLYYPLPGILQLLEERYTVLQTEELDAKAASRVSAVFTGRRVDRPFLDSLPNLRLVVNLGVGVDNIDVDYCRQRGIRITNAVHSRIITDTADSAILLMLASLRRLCPANSFVQDGSWTQGLTFPLARKMLDAGGWQVLNGCKYIQKLLNGMLANNFILPASFGHRNVKFYPNRPAERLSSCPR